MIIVVNVVMIRIEIVCFFIVMVEILVIMTLESPLNVMFIIKMRLIFRIVKYIIIFAHIPEDMMLTRVNRDLFLPLTMRKCYSIFLLVTLLLDSCWLWLSFWSSFSILFLKRSSNFGVLLCL